MLRAIRTVGLIAAVAIGVTIPATAQQHGGHHGGHSAPRAAAPAPASPGAAQPNAAAIKAFEEANAKMHRDMAVPLSGNPDVDFVRGMIPHHQGAIDMAEIVLKHGKDPQIRKLAREIIKAQKSEIAMMRRWLERNDKGK